MSRVLSGQQRYQPSEYRVKEIEHYEAQPARFMCAFCEWKFEGTVAQGKKKSLAHREKRHPETIGLPRRRGRGRSLSTFRYAQMDTQSINEIETERHKRAFLNGVEIVE